MSEIKRSTLSPKIGCSRCGAVWMRTWLGFWRCYEPPEGMCKPNEHRLSGMPIADALSETGLRP